MRRIQGCRANATSFDRLCVGTCVGTWVSWRCNYAVRVVTIMAERFLAQRFDADCQQVQPDGVGSSYQFGEAPRLRQRVLAGGADAVDIADRFGGGREKFAYTRDAKRSLLVGSELAADFADTSLHNASPAERDAFLATR